jgi:hypothetical protein
VEDTSKRFIKLQFLVSEDERSKIVEQARRMGISVADFMRLRALGFRCELELAH